MLEQEGILDEVEIVDLLLVPDQLIQGQQQLVQVNKLGQLNQFLGQLLKLMRGASTGCVPAYPIAVGDAAEAESMG